MPPFPLQFASSLDPRPAAQATQAPIRGAVNIPLEELPNRTHELPPPDEIIPVAGPADLLAQTIAVLQRLGRRGAPLPSFEFAAPGELLPPYRLWRPSAFLAEVVACLPAGRALDLGCGTGRDAVYLAALGWHVTGVDVLPDALERARALATRHVGELAPLDWQVADLEHHPPSFTSQFDLVVMLRYLHRPLLATCASWLHSTAAGGGSLVVECFTTIHRARHGKPARPHDVLAPGELRDLLHGYELRHYSEDWRGPLHTARAWAVTPPQPPAAAMAGHGQTGASAGS
jgi:SAM-dependent methyltransferase